MALTAATRTIHLANSYFVPDEHINAETVRRASRARWGELLEAGAEIYAYELTMFHCKVLIVDGAHLGRVDQLRQSILRAQ